MKVCPLCGFRHLDEDERCLRCGASLDAEAFAGRLRAQARPGPNLRPRWPARLAAALRRRAFFLRRALAGDLPEGVHDRNPWLAAFLALVPGLGQLYNHQPLKALWILLWIAACCGAAAATFYLPISNWVLLAGLGAWVYGFHDALTTAKRINRDTLTWQHALGFYCAWFFYLCFSFIVFQYLAAHFLVRFYTIGHDALNPWLRKDERVVVEMLSRPRVGDVVMYNPPKMEVEFAGEIENTHATLDPRSTIERIVAGPGQTIERREGIFYRDGRELSLNEEPLLSDMIPLNFKMTAPPGAYIILYTYTFGRDWMTGANAPRLNTPGMIVHGGAEMCEIRPDQIVGRVWCVYNPPPSRRWLR